MYLINLSKLIDMAFYKNPDTYITCNASELSSSDTFYVSLAGNPAVYKIQSYTVDNRIIAESIASGNTIELKPDKTVYRRKTRLIDIF